MNRLVAVANFANEAILSGLDMIDLELRAHRATSSGNSMYLSF